MLSGKETLSKVKGLHNVNYLRGQEEYLRPEEPAARVAIVT